MYHKFWETALLVTKSAYLKGLAWVGSAGLVRNCEATTALNVDLLMLGSYCRFRVFWSLMRYIWLLLRQERATTGTNENLSY